MRKAALALAVLASAVVASMGSASAQSLESEYAGPNLRYGTKGYYFDNSTRYGARAYEYTRPSYGPRVYGYTSYYGEPEVMVGPPAVELDARPDRRVHGGCGEYRYWNGEYCADARNR